MFFLRHHREPGVATADLALLVAVALSALVLNAGAAAPAWSQGAQLQDPAPAAAPAPAPEPHSGLVDELQKLFPLPSLSTPSETIDSLNRRARDAGDNLSRLSRQEVVSGRVKCPTAANGAPDCKVAANRLCTDKGFKEGRSIDSDSAEDCPAAVIMADKPPVQAECRVENFVIRALCQR